MIWMRFFLIFIFLFNSAWASNLDYFSAPPAEVCGAAAQCTANAKVLAPISPHVLEAPAVSQKIIKYYFSPQCSHCRELKRTLLPQLRKLYPQNLEIREFDILASQPNLNELIQLTQRYRGGQARVPAMLVEGELLVGTHEINLEKLQALLGVAPELTPHAVSVNAAAVFAFPAWGALIAAAFLDGINPCAFATILFFVTYLTFLKKERKYILQIGIAFIVGVFVCYFLLGLGIFHLILKLQAYDLVSFWFSKILGVLALGLGFLSLYDFYIYKKTGQSHSMILQLPMRLKKIIHRIIRTGVDS
jgi:hypothetical protein